MKRSEMIKKLMETEMFMTEGHAKIALETVEDAGMLPPFCHDLFHKEWNEHASLQGGNTWEPEDAD